MKELSANTKWLAVFSVLGATLLAVGANIVPHMSDRPEARTYTATLVSAGNNTTQTILEGGTKAGRGLNNFGQLGDGTNISTRKWVGANVEQFGEITNIESTNHSVAINSKGEVYTWGDGRDGVIGNGSLAPCTAPSAVTASYYFASVSAGADFSVALDSFGNIYSWGANEFGQLGTGNNEPATAPTKIIDGTKFLSVKAGKNYAVALDTENNLWAWGANEFGQLGTGNNDDSAEPLLVAGKKFAQISTNSISETTVAIGLDGKLYSWGLNNYGQLGNGTDWREEQRQENARVAAEIQRIKDADEERKQDLIEECETVEQEKRDAEADAQKKYEEDYEKWLEEKTIAEEEGQPVPPEPEKPVVEEPVDCVAEIEGTFEYTDTSNLKPRVIPEPPLQANSNTPVLANTPRTYKQVTVGAQNGYAITSDGKLEAWGTDTKGKTGIGVDEETHTQVPVQLNGTFKKVEAGENFVVALADDGKVYSWGTGLGLGAGNADLIQTKPAVVGTGFKDVFAGPVNGYAVAEDGRLFAWGSGQNGLLGDGGTENSLTFKEVAKNFRSISVANKTVVALRGNGNLSTWGSNESGLFANNETSETVVAEPSTYLVNEFLDVAVAESASFAVDRKGFLWAWGSNVNGQLGVTGVDSSSRPLLVPTKAQMKKVTASPTNTVLLAEDNSVWVSGAEQWTVIPSNLNAVDVVATSTHVYLLTDNGDVFRYDLTVEGSKFEQFTSGVEFITSGGDAVLAVTVEGELYGWGEHVNGLVSSEEPALIGEGYKTASISTTHAVALTVEGNVYGWGTEPYGTFGNTVTNVEKPYPLPVPDDFEIRNKESE